MNDGIAVVTATTEGVNQNGDVAQVWNTVPVVFSMNITANAETSKDSLRIGEEAVITITVMDINGNPVIFGSTIRLTTTNGGSVSPTIITTYDPGSPIYVIVLTNNLTTLGTATSTRVNISITSDNGTGNIKSPPIWLYTSP